MFALRTSKHSLRLALAGLALALSAPLALAHSPKKDPVWWQYENPELGVSFHYPAGWRVRVADERTIHVTQRGAPKKAEPVATLIVLDKPLEAAADDMYERTEDGNGWVISGRFSRVPAKLELGDGWRRISAVVTCGFTDENGFHAGGECLSGMVGGEKKTVDFSAGGADVPTEAGRIFRSVRVLD